MNFDLRPVLRFLCLFWSAQLFGSDWSMYMGNHHLTGNNDGVVPPAFNLVWKARFPYPVFHAVASDGLLFVSGYSREIRSLVLNTGKQRWRSPVPFPVIRMPVIWGRLLFVSAGRSMLCFDKWSGRLLWSRSSGGFSQLASPIVVGGVLFYGNRGAFFAREAATGRQLWKSRGVMSYGASPLYADGRLYLQHRDYKSMQYSLLCLDARNGRKLWSRTIPGDANIFTPSVYRGSVYMVSANRVMAFSVSEGTPGAVYQLKGRAASSPAFVQDKLYVCDSRGTLNVLQPDDLRSLSTFSHYRARGNRFAAVGPWLYLCNDTGDLLEVDRLTGRISRKYSFGVRGTHFRPLVSLGKVILPAGNTLFCIGKAEKDGEQLPERGVLRLFFVHSVTGKPLSGRVRLVWRRGSRWWSGRFELKHGRVSLEERRLFPSRMTFEKRGFLFQTRKVKESDRGRALKIFLKPISRDSRLVFRNILFNTDSSGLLPSSIPVLQRLVRFLRFNPGVKIQIEGHTDSSGSVQRNRTLSLARATVVRDYLIRQNIPALRLGVRGLGQSSPVASNRTAAGRLLNRRTEIRIISVSAQMPGSRGEREDGYRKSRDRKRGYEEESAGQE